MRWYEIGFDGDVVEAVRRISPVARVTNLPTCTILWSSSSGDKELDSLLDTLLSLGISPSEVHESGGAAPYAEVRLRGSLGDALLRYLGWSHRVARSTVVRLQSSPDDLRALVLKMADVARVDYVLAL